MLSFEIARQLARTAFRDDGPPRSAAAVSAPASALIFQIDGQIEEIQGTGLAAGFFVLPEGEARGIHSETREAGPTAFAANHGTKQGQCKLIAAAFRLM
jgi:hypothetical protein